MTATRRLAAVMAINVVGYSRLMGGGRGAKTPAAVRQHSVRRLPAATSYGR